MKAYILTVTPDDANYGMEIIGIYKTKESASNELEEILNEYAEHNEAYNVTRDDALEYYNPEIKEYTIQE